MNFVLWIVTTAPFTRSTSGATVPGSAPGGGAARATDAATAAAAALAAINDDTAGRIIRRQGDGHLVAENHANAVLPKLAAEVSEHLMAVLELDAEITRRQDLDHAALEFNVLFATHVGREKYIPAPLRSTCV